MSQETLTWLNQNTLIGNTDKRGRAWHYKASEQGDQPNHYPGFIPVADVKDRLFNWQALETIPTAGVNPNGVVTFDDGLRNGFKFITRSDSGLILGVPKDGWQPHQFDTWLLDEVAAILDDDLGISSAGLLKKGAVAWVEVSIPDTITTPSGVEFRPNLLAITSHNSDFATTYKKTVQLVVCDNTLRAAASEKGQTFKVKHTRNSSVKLAEARQALEIVHTIADDFTAEVEELTNTTVTDAQFAKFLDELLPVDPEASKRSKTIAANKRDALVNLYDNDVRVAPWRGTAFGVRQAVNTADHHVWSAKGDRVERNQLKAISGGFDVLDSNTLATLEKVLAEA